MDKNCEGFCNHLREKYEQLLLHQEREYQQRFHDMKGNLEMVLSTHIPLKQHQNLLDKLEANVSDQYQNTSHQLLHNQEQELKDVYATKLKEVEQCHQAHIIQIEKELKELQVSHSYTLDNLQIKTNGRHKV